MRKLFLILMILVIPFIYAVDIPECQREQFSTDVPCTVISSYVPSNGCNYNLTIYRQNGTIIQNQTWTNFTPQCGFIWNITEADTYQYISGIEDGVITIIREDEMLSIVLVQLFIVTFFIILGIPHPAGFTKIFSWALAVIEVLITVWMVYINEIGGSLNNLLYLNAISILIIGGFVGLYTLYFVVIKLARPDSDGLGEDRYVKWAYGK